MKKIISILTITTVMLLLIFSQNSYAASLDNVNVQADKQEIAPSENVKVTISFGENLGAYTFNIAYDTNVFDYVEVDGGTANNTQDKVIVTYYDQTGGTNPRNNMTITFKAKSDITTATQGKISVTAEGLGNADASVVYDDITTPIVKNITVKPETVVTPPAETPGDTTNDNPSVNENTNVANQEEKVAEEKNTIPNNLPKTGENIYLLVAIALTLLCGIYVYNNKNK